MDANLKKELKQLSPWKVGLGVFLLLYLLNWAAVEWGYRPFLYCWLRPLGGIFEGWLYVANIIALVYFALAVLSKKPEKIFVAMLWVVLIYGGPQYLTVILSLGRSCG
jgi:hypothetical protein